MKIYIKEFCKRGLIAFGFGPIVIAIVYLSLEWSGVCDALSLSEVAKQIILVSVMAFLAAGITVVYQIEKLPLPIAILIQATVLYIDYISAYLINGWIKSALVPIAIFTVAFILGFALIWCIVYIVTKKHTKSLNEQLKEK